MSVWRRPRIPTTLFARLVGLLAVTLLLTQLVGGFLFFLIRPPPGPLIVHISEIASALEGQRAMAGPVVLGDPFPSEAFRLRALEPILADRLGLPRYDVRLVRVGPVPPHAVDTTANSVDPVLVGGYRAAARWGDGWVIVRRGEFGTSDIVGRMLQWLVVSLAVIAPVAILLVARLTSPITAFAEAADRLGRDPYARPMRYTGPDEVVLTVRAFNDMQARLRDYIDDRVRMVGAIAHDLRTPLTRLSLQLQALPAPRRARAEAEIERMRMMVDGALAFVKDVSSASERLPLRLFSLVEAVIDDLPASAEAIELHPGPDPVIMGDESSLRRAFANLLQNAVLYGGAAACRVMVADPWVVIQIDDTGPGLAPADLDRAFEPYVRFSAQEAGIGLGLSIVRTIVRAHGGEVVLSNQPKGGLRAEVRLPAHLPQA